MKKANVVFGVFIVAGAGVGLWVFLRRAKAVSAGAAGGGVVVQNPPNIDNPNPPGGGAGGGGGASLPGILGAVGSTVGTVSGIVAAAGGAGAAAAAGGGAAVVTAVPAAGALGAGVGGGGVAGSVAATQAATANAGASSAAGSTIAGGGVGIGTVAIISGIGAALAIGYFIWRAKRNDTKEDREDFVESMGSITVNGVIYPMHSDATGTQFDHLHAAMLAVDPTVGEQLWIEATQQIGKKDRTANVAWMHKVLRLFGLESAPAVINGGLDVYEEPFEDELEKPLDVEQLELV